MALESQFNRASFSRLTSGSFLLASIIGLAGFVYVAMDGHLYWHEARLLFAVTHFSIPELLAGQFNPNQLGGDINEIGSAGYHLTKALYLMALDRLTRLPMSPDHQLMLGSLVSLLALLVCGLCVRSVMENLGASPSLSSWSALAFFMMPSTPYLAGKLLSEVAAMLPAFVGLVLWSSCLANARSSNWVRALGASLLIATTAVMRLDMTIVHASFALATLITSTALDRPRLIRFHLAILACAVALYALYLASQPGAYSSILEYLRQYLLLDPKSHLMSAFGLASFAGLMWVFAVVGIISFDRLSALLIIWLMFALIPMVTVVANYMIEPRYLVSASLALAGLAGAGLQRAFSRAPSDLAPRSLAIILVIAFINFLAVPLMPYEVDRAAILRAADKYAPRDSVSTMLVPWSYTDYHFLRFARPDSRIYNVHTPAGDPDGVTKEWSARLHDWYGDHYVSDVDSLAALGQQEPVYYLGWGVYPPIQTILSWADKVPIEDIGRRLGSQSFMRHREQSWLWTAPGYHFKLAERFGQYEVYEVTAEYPETAH